MLACTPEHLVGVLGSSPVLSIAHPGHEMRVYGIVRATRPTTCVLTDGSGGAGQPRIDTCRTLLDDLHVPTTGLFGRFRDRDFYELLLTGNAAPLVALVHELADLLVHSAATCVIGDAVEGFNTAHDLFCDLTNVATCHAERRTGRQIPRYVFPLIGPPHTLAYDDPAATLELDDALLAQKLERAHSYQGLTGHVQQALDAYGTKPFRREYLWRISSYVPLHPVGSLCYEAFALDRVRSGRYQKAITRVHVQAISAELWRTLQ